MNYGGPQKTDNMNMRYGRKDKGILKAQIVVLLVILGEPIYSMKLLACDLYHLNLTSDFSLHQ